MLELDLVLEAFAGAELEHMSAGERALFSRLLDATDPELWDWVSKRSEPADPALAGLVGRLRAVRHAAHGGDARK